MNWKFKIGPFGYNQDLEELTFMEQPKIKVVFWYGAHEGPRDLEHWNKIFKRYKPDMYAMETGAFDSKMAENVSNDFNKHLKNPSSNEHFGQIPRIYSLFSDDFKITEISKLQAEKEKTKLLLIDSQPKSVSDKIQDQQHSVIFSSHSSIENFVSGSFDKAIQSFKKYRHPNEEASYKEREKYIIKHILDLKDKIRNNHPELKTKKEITILFRLGAYHTWPYIHLKKTKPTGILVERVFDSNPAVLDPLIRKKTLFANNKPNEQETRQFIARQIFAEAILHFLDASDLKSNSLETATAADIIANKFSFDEIRNFSEKLRPIGGKILESPKEFIPPLSKFLALRKVKLPNNKKELSNLIRGKFGYLGKGPWFTADSVPK